MRRWRTDGAARRVAASLALLILVVALGLPSAGRAESQPPVSASFSSAKLERVGDYIKTFDVGYLSEQEMRTANELLTPDHLRLKIKALRSKFGLSKAPT